MTEIDFQRDFLILQLHILQHNPFGDWVGQEKINGFRKSNNTRQN